MSSTFYPVLIGSQALKAYGYPTADSSDYDLLVDLDKADALYLDCSKRDRNLC